jgi:CIC family chloride channel protein
MNIKRQSQRLQFRIIRLFSNKYIPEDFYFYFLAALVGILAGVGAVLLNKIVDLIHHLFFGQYFSYFAQNPTARYIVLISIPAMGGLLVGMIIHFFAGENVGHGVPGVIEAISDREGLIKKRLSIVTLISSGTLIGSGGSAGKEGPIIQIGAAFGSTVGQFFRVSANRLKILVGAGAGAGLAAVFNAPVTGVLFSLEVLLKDFSINAFSPIIISTVIATTISHHFIGTTPLYKVPTYQLNSPIEYIFYLLMGILGGIVSVGFIKIFYSIEDIFHKLENIPNFVKPAIGGLLVGILAIKFPQIYGWDDSAIHSSIVENQTILVLFFLMVIKIFATSFSLGSGGTGGLFTPSLFIGATFGALIGVMFNELFPGIPADPGAYALVGMGIMIAGTTHAVLSAMLLIFEITGDYAIILPLMLGITAATLAARKFELENIYTFKLRLKNELYLRGKRKEILETLPVVNLMRKEFEYLKVTDKLKQIWEKFKISEFDSLPVLDRYHHLVGMISFRDIKIALFEKELDEFVIAADIANPKVFKVSEQASVYDALNIFDLTDYDVLPVMSVKNPNKIVGMICKKDIENFYRQEYLKKL